MISYTRPAAPPAFAVPPGQKVEDARRAVEAAVQRGQAPAFPNLWSDEEGRRRLASAQHNKCGYCESVVVTDPPEVEHYAPKGEVEALLEMGQERPGLINVTDRKMEKVYELGYWWMAYQWRNYLLACDRCNSAWKKSIFTVADEPRSALPRSEFEVHRLGWPWLGETPMLLNPYDTPDLPAHYFEFGALGQITGMTARAVETIRTCGLDRPSLRQQRATVYSACEELIHDYLHTADLTDREQDRLLRALRRAGEATRAYAGVVRWLIDRHLDMRWGEFELATRYLESPAP